MAKFHKSGFMHDDPLTCVTSLLPRKTVSDALAGESLAMARSFSNEFADSKCNNPSKILGLLAS